MIIQVAYKGNNRVLLEVWIDWADKLFCSVNVEYSDIEPLLDCDGIPTEEDLKKLVDKLNKLLS